MKLYETNSEVVNSEVVGSEIVDSEMDVIRQSIYRITRLYLISFSYRKVR